MYSSLFEQVTVQDVSTMIRNGQNPIIFMIKNGGYTIEVEIHDGPYNVIKNWNYTSVVDALHNGEGKCWTVKVFFLYIHRMANPFTRISCFFCDMGVFGCLSFFPFAIC